MFLAQYEPPRLLAFRGYTAVVELELGDQHNPVNWCRRIVRPDGRVDWAGFCAVNWDDAEAHARHDLAHRSTDWHDEVSAHRSRRLSPPWPTTRRRPERAGRAVPLCGRWQRAARAATEAGSENVHEWASAHEHEFAIPRPAEKAC